MKFTGNYTKKHAFTLIELIIVIAILSFLTATIIIGIVGLINKSKTAADLASLRILNDATHFYGKEITTVSDDIFYGIAADQERMNKLITEGYLQAVITPQTENKQFNWQTATQEWTMENSDIIHDSTQFLTPFGNDFIPISTGLIDAIQKNFALKSKYGRNWGDYAYTDIGLNPSDWGWSKSVNHIRYVAGGSSISIRPEDGYTISVVSAVDHKSIKDLNAKLQWNIIYDDLTKKWYYHTISPENEIDINTIKVYK